MTRMQIEWDHFLLPYQQALEELKVKLKGVRTQYKQQKTHGPIEFVTSRVKPIESILEKQIRLGIADADLSTDMEDIAGIRIMSQFVEDIYDVVNLLRQREDLTILEERDYITHQKESGYRSYHLICLYPVQLSSNQKNVLVEIQIRTLAMNFWATIEHSLNYKYKGEYPEEIKRRLKKSAESAFQLDEEMSHIRSEIKDAQSYYSSKKRKKEIRETK